MTKLAIRVEYTNPYSSASNGIAEIAMQTIMSAGNSLRIAARLPKAAWAECCCSAAFLDKRMPTTANAGLCSPYELVFGSVPDLSDLRAIGCVAYVHVHKPERSALDPRVRRGILVGYARSSPGYRVLINTRTGEIKKTMHVTFVERFHSGCVAKSLPGHAFLYFPSFLRSS
jgi:hypothetical protein